MELEKKQNNKLRGYEMIIPEITTEVKEKIRKNLQPLHNFLSIPKYKFLLEMVTGILSTGSVNLMEICISLKESISTKYTHKRLCNNVKTGGKILDIVNQYILSKCSKLITPESCLYMDGGDISYSTASQYENIGIVHDGSTGKLKPGYPTNLIVCKDKTGRVFPLYFNIYHRQGEYKSDNAETLKGMLSIINKIGNKGIWILDRGYDRQTIIDELISHNCNFLIRMIGKRHLKYKDNNVLAKDLAHNNRLQYSYMKDRYHFKQCFYKETAVTLIYYNNQNVDMILMSSGHITRKKEIEKQISLYIGRWSVEEGHKFMKQAFGLEKARTSIFESTKCIAGMALLAWYVLYKIAKDGEFKENVCKTAETYNTKTIKFDYYRIIRAIKFLFRQCKEMFRFRNRKKENYQPNIEDFLAEFDTISTIC